MSFDGHRTQLGLSIGIPLFCCKSVPLHRSLIVLRNTFSIAVHLPQIVLGGSTPLFSKGFPFTQGASEIFT